MGEEHPSIQYWCYWWDYIVTNGCNSNSISQVLSPRIWRGIFHLHSNGVGLCCTWD